MPRTGLHQGLPARQRTGYGSAARLTAAHQRATEAATFPSLTFSSRVMPALIR